MQNLKLSDNAIAKIVQLLQLGILTGTDVTDQLRTLKLSVGEGTDTLVPSQEFVEVFNENLERLTQEADAAASVTSDPGVHFDS